MHHFYKNHASHARWIAAHRQTWFESGLLDLTSRNKQSQEAQLLQLDQRPDARRKDHNAGTRPQIAIYNLIQKLNVADGKIANAVRSGDSGMAERIARENKHPLSVINDLLRYANIPISISERDKEEVLAIKGQSVPYSVAELSDGERNALLIAADVLTADPGTLLLLDEPERHLHRSIISPLLTALFIERADCIFVISTHEVMLPIDNPSSQTLLVRGCTYNGTSVAGWDASLTEAYATVDEELQKDILGARRRVLFVEGTASSLDKRLYSILFPSVSVIPKQDCRNVEHAVRSIRNSENLHWVKAYGIIDRDARPDDEIAELQTEGIYSLDFYSVKSIYYERVVRECVAKRVKGDEYLQWAEEARMSALGAARQSLDNLCGRVAERKIQQEYMSHMPNRKRLPLEDSIDIHIDARATLDDVHDEFNRMIEDGNLESIIARYPFRESNIRSCIAHKLGFASPKAYEDAVITLLKEDVDVFNHIRALFGDLRTQLSDG